MRLVSLCSKYKYCIVFW